MASPSLSLYPWIGFIFSGLVSTGLIGPSTLAHELNSAFIPTQHQASIDPLSAPVQAIVQLETLPLTPPIFQGTARIPYAGKSQFNLVTVEGQLQNQPERFLIDTGASTTLLSRPLVSRLRLKGQSISGDRLSAAAAGDNCKAMDATLHQLPPLTMGQLQVEKLQGLEFLNTPIPYGLSGILGMNLLSNFDLKIYPTAQQVSLTPRSLTPPPSFPKESITKTVRLQRRLGVILTQIKVNQKGPFTVLIDTGAATTFISPEVAQAAQINDQLRTPVKIQGFCGFESAYRVMSPTLQLGIYQLQQVDTVVLNSSVIKSLQIDGILGQNVLNRFDQYWRFPDPKVPDSQARGSLVLRPVQPIPHD